MWQWLKNLFKPKVQAKVIPIRPEPKIEDVSPIKLSPIDKTPWITLAKREIGVTEVPGERSNARIEEYHKAVGLFVHDDVPWCSAFVGWCLERSGYKSTKNALARSYLKWGFPMERPEYGCVVVFWRKTPQSASGHVGFFLADMGDMILVLGGNQNDKVCEKYYPASQVLAYRWPKEKI